MIDYSLPFYYESIGILIQQPEMEKSCWKMFSLFSKSTWILILVSILVSSTILYILHKFSAVPLDSAFNTFGECLWCSMSTFLNQG